MSAKIVVVGSANTDMVVRVDDIPHLGETVLGGQLVTAQGGKGANQAVAAARLGADVTFIARLGRDNFGAASLSSYQTEDIHTDYIAWDDDAPSGVALIMVNRNGENIIAVAPGANELLSPVDVENAESVFRDADALLVQLEIPINTVQTAIDLARRYHVRVILNPAPASSLIVSNLQSVDYLTPNESELAVLMGTKAKQDYDAVKEFTARMGLRVLIVTQGAKGAQVFAEGNGYIVSGLSVNTVDTVAAGDAFNGALAVALSNNVDLYGAVKFANAAGALSVTRVGAQPSLPTNEEVERFLKLIDI